jgi:hypothetical protein
VVAQPLRVPVPSLMAQEVTTQPGLPGKVSGVWSLVKSQASLLMVFAHELSILRTRRS